MATTLKCVDLDSWTAKVENLSKQYQSAEPYPHIHFENFLDRGLAKQLEAEFPKLVSAEWTLYKHYNQDKAGLTKRSLMPETLGQLVDEFNSDAFVAWLSRLTGIPNLVADPISKAADCTRVSAADT
jgi:hypothetical protein